MFLSWITAGITYRRGSVVCDKLITLRNSDTSYVLPQCSLSVFKRSFINRCLFTLYIYHHCNPGFIYQLSSLSLV